MRTAAFLLTLMLAPLTATAAPLQVALGLHVVELRSVDSRAQSFYLDTYLWLRFQTTGLTPERITEVIDRLEPVNGRFDSKDLVDDKVVGDERYVCYRVRGTFFFVPDLRKYPFDTQALPFTVENASLEADDLRFVDDRVSYERGGTPEARWGLSPTLSIPDYTLARVERTVHEATYPTNFGDPSKEKADTRYSRFTLRVYFEREYWSYAFKILVPLLIILAMVYLVFFLPPKELGTTASIAITSLLSCMAFNIAVSQSMPEIGYLVLSDKFFIATYVLLLLTLAETVVTFVLDAAGRTALALRLARISRVAFPVTLAVIFGAFFAGV